MGMEPVHVRREDIARYHEESIMLHGERARRSGQAANRTGKRPVDMEKESDHKTHG
ncbi:hypothetical protein scyTo_0022586, partial [Scyliorhinus torazame]|nr:hypothetical protein [Scyliorhinus torazame]